VTSCVPDHPLPMADRSSELIRPPQLSITSIPNLQPHQEDQTEVIDVDENGEDGNSDPSDGENEEDPDDVIEVPATAEPPSESGIKVTVFLK